MFRLKYTDCPSQAGKLNREFIGNPIDDFSKIFDRFNEAYGIRTLIAADELHKRQLISPSKRVCRFCGRSRPLVKFKSKAHLLPRSIGNVHLLSDFECDSCNSLFGQYENHLCNFLGLSRILDIKNVKSGKHKFISPDESLHVFKEEGIEENKIRLDSHGEDNNHFTLDKGNRTVTFHTTRPGYNPFLVWKAFLKMGLSLLPNDLVSDYVNAVSILRSSTKNDGADSPICKMNVWVHKGPAFPSPMAILFERKNAGSKVPMHIAAIMFQNYTYQLVLPLCERDRGMYDGKTIISVPNMPPFIDKHFAEEFGSPRGQRLDFNLNELKRGERHDLSYSFDSYKDSRDN